MPWYYVENGQQAGPVTDSEFESLVASGRILPETLVWREGMENWMPWSQVRATSMATADLSAPAGFNPGQGFEESSTASYGHGMSGSAGATVQCNECGRFFNESEVISYGTINVCAACKPDFIQRLREGGRPSAEVMEYAGFWIRLLARFIDGVIFFVVAMILGIGLGVSMNLEALAGGNANFPPHIAVVFFVLPFLYEALMLAYFGQTLGKMVVRVKVVNPDGSKLSLWQVLCRTAWYQWISVIPFFIGTLIQIIGCLMAAFDPEKRALHDRIMRTRVIRV